MVLTLTSLIFIIPYIASSFNEPNADVTESPINVTGLNPHNPLRLFIFAILFGSGVGLLVKGFV